jgi:hypothetical protein
MLAIFIASPEVTTGNIIIRCCASAWDQQHQQLWFQRYLARHQSTQLAQEVGQIKEEAARALGLPVRVVTCYDHRGRQNDLPVGFYSGISKEEWGDLHA